MLTALVAADAPERLERLVASSKWQASVSWYKHSTTYLQKVEARQRVVASSKWQASVSWYKHSTKISAESRGSTGGGGTVSMAGARSQAKSTATTKSRVGSEADGRQGAQSVTACTEADWS